jgi:HAT1-interacting factor 1
MHHSTLTENGIQVEELKTSPNESLATSAPALAAQALDRELNAAGSSASKAAPAIVNDLTSIVKKKKKAAPEDPSAGKRKAESEAEPTNADKKVKLDTPDA